MKTGIRNGIFLLVITAAGFALRIYKIPEVFFLEGDIARDWLVIFNSWEAKKPILTGPLSSFAGIFNGSMYYYSMAPVVILSNLNPHAIWITAIVVGLFEIFLIYKVALEVFSKNSAIVITVIFALSVEAIKLSHTLWNPNFLPLFTLLILYFLIRAAKERSLAKMFVAAAIAGFGLQFHYGFGLVIPAIFFVTRHLRSAKNYLKTLAFSLLVILLFFLPTAIFELRHNFVMTQTFLSYQSTGGALDLAAIIPNLAKAQPATHLFALITNDIFPATFVPITLAVIFVYFYFIRQKMTNAERLLWNFFWLTLVLFMLSPLTIHRYYLTTLFPLPFLLAGSVLCRLTKTYFQVVSLSLVIIFTAILVRSDTWTPPLKNLKQQQRAAWVIASDKPENNKFNVVTFGNTPFHSAWDYRFLLRNLGFRSLLADQYDRAEILYLVAEGPMEEPLKAASWETSQFSPKKVYKLQQLPNGWQIFKLLREN